MNCGVDVARGLTGKNQPKRDTAGGSSVRAPSATVDATSVPGWSCGHCVPSVVVTTTSDSHTMLPPRTISRVSTPAGTPIRLRLSEVPPPTVSSAPSANVASSSITDPALLSEMEPPSVVADAEKLEFVTVRLVSCPPHPVRLSEVPPPTVSSAPSANDASSSITDPA